MLGNTAEGKCRSLTNKSQFKEEISDVKFGAHLCTMLELGHFITLKFWNEVLAKDGEDQLYWSCEKWSITYSQGWEEHPTCNKRRKSYWIVHLLPRKCLLKHAIKGKIERTGRRGRRRKQLMDNSKETRGYWKLKQEASDRTLRRIRFGRECGPAVK
jgi:hypothetical protein